MNNGIDDLFLYFKNKLNMKNVWGNETGYYIFKAIKVKNK